MNSAISHFKEWNLDAMFIATNAPGRSAYNRVERRMAPLSRDLSGLILDHAHFGTHLDEKGMTVDAELEQKNFEHAGNVLAEIWSSTVIDGHPTLAEYIQPEGSELSVDVDVNAKWRASHVRESHYFFQVAFDFECVLIESLINIFPGCKMFRSKLLQ